MSKNKRRKIMANKYVQREGELIVASYELPQANAQEKIDTSSTEYVEYETKTGPYTPVPVGEQYYCLRDKRSGLIVDLKKHSQHGYESILSTDAEFIEYITCTGGYLGTSNDDSWWTKGFNPWFIKAYLEKEYEGNTTLMDQIHSSMMPK
jgi:hypothetical protein